MGVNFIEHNLGVFDGVVYNGKFDIHFDNLIQICQDFGVEVLIVTTFHESEIDDLVRSFYMDI
jgi:hypothetical protein